MTFNSVYLFCIFAKTSFTAADEDVILITGGYNGSNFLSTCEVLPSPCSVPSFPGNVFSAPHYSHTTARTADGLILTCGGINNSRKCLMLDLQSNSWISHSRLDQSRISSTAVTMSEGLFLFGDDLYDETTSSFLPTGSTEWEKGPTPPGDGITGACGVVVSEFRFLLIGGRHTPNQVVEYNMKTGQWLLWPELVKGRGMVACAKQGDNIIMSGGENDSSTSILHIPSRQERRAGDMNSVRGSYFHMIELNGNVFAIGGDNGYEYLDSIEEWNNEHETWEMTEMHMKTARYSFSVAAGPQARFCQSTLL